MTTDKRTKAQLLAEMDEMRARLVEAEKRPIPREPERVPLADALARCVRALDELNKRRDNYGYSKTSGDVEQVINLLCEKYGVRRIERVEVPCELTHVEDLTAADFLQVVQRDFGMSNLGAMS